MPDLPRDTGSGSPILGRGTSRGEGTLFHQPVLASTLDWLASEGDAPFTDGELADELVSLCQDHGQCCSSRDDLAQLPRHQARPLCIAVTTAGVATNPPLIGGT